jgi:hypothetical protein
MKRDKLFRQTLAEAERVLGADATNDELAEWMLQQPRFQHVAVSHLELRLAIVQTQTEAEFNQGKPL